MSVAEVKPFEVTLAEAMAIATLRGILSGMTDRARNCVHGTTASRAFSLGRFSEAAEEAGDAIFNVLNVASSHLDDPIAKEWVHSKGVTP